MKTNRILLTGGAGYLGGHIALELLQHGYEVVVVDRLLVNSSCTKGQIEKPESLRRIEKLAGKKLVYKPVDLLDVEALRAFFRSEGKFDGVIHTAGIKGGSISCSEPINFYQANLGLSLNLIQVLEEQDWNIKRFVFTSAGATYNIPKFEIFQEDDDTSQSSTPYGRAKYMVETILRDVCSAKDWNVISLRPFNIIGAHSSGQIGEDPSGPPANLVPYVANVALGKRSSLTIFGSDYSTPDGTGIQDYVHVMDVAAAHVCALKTLMKGVDKKERFKAYNVSHGVGYSVLEVVKAFREVSGKEVKVEFGDRREGDIYKIIGSNRKIKSELNWEPMKTLRDMCADTWNWTIKNPNGYKN